MKRQVGLALCLAWVAVFLLAGPSEAVRYRYENLGTLGGNQNYTSFDGKEIGINDLGQVVGMSYTASGALHAFLKSPGQAMQALPLPSGATEAHATCINHSGLIGGFSSDGFLWNACKWVPGPIYQCNLLGLLNSKAFGINDGGYLAGLSSPTGYNHAYAVSPGGSAQDLGTLPGHVSSEARAINSANTIVGVSYDGSNVPTACVWTFSGGVWAEATSLFGVANSRASSINSSGQAAGTAIMSGTYQAVLKSPGLALQDVGPYPTSACGANDINDSGWVVGSPGFLWTPALGAQLLSNLVVNLPAGVSLYQPMAINNRGEIAGYSRSGSGFNGVFKLTPIPEPPLSLLLFD